MNCLEIKNDIRDNINCRNSDTNLRRNKLDDKNRKARDDDREL